MSTNWTQAEEKKWQKERKSMAPVFILQVVLSLLVTPSVLYGGYFMCSSIPVPLSSDLGDKLTFYISCCVFPCAVLMFISILNVIGKRITTPAGNPLSGRDHFLVVEKNFLTNTLEQTQLFLLVALALTSYLDAHELKVLPIYTLLWFTGRIFFRIGYAINPTYRSFGILLNMQSTGVFISILFYLVFTRGIPGAASSGGRTSRSEEL